MIELVPCGISGQCAVPYGMFSGEGTESSDAVRVSIIAPFRNEAKNLPWFIEHVPEWVDEVIFVNGRSHDDSVEVISRLMPSAKVIDQPGIGKGVALAFGMLSATGDVVIAIDTDGSMDPSLCGHYVQPLLDGADLVKGSRYLPGGGSEDLTALRSAGNRCLTMSANVLFRQDWSELCYGYFALWSQHLTHLEVDELVAYAETAEAPKRFYGSGFEIETLLFCRAARRQLGVVEVPSYEHPRAHGQSNLRTFRDGLRVVWGLFLERRRSTEVALSPAAAL
jgi:glycosyltransferase involved in cell wall biosynthesis